MINASTPSAIDIAKADHLFRYLGFDKISKLLNIIYQLDVFITVAACSTKMGFNFPIIQNDGKPQLLLKGLFHPLIESPVLNNIDFNDNQNISFITGTNMAGKSTLLKAIGISVLLSQMGFPVPASYMLSSGFNGLMSTINLSDNITQGNSHFYSEVLRVKQVVQTIAQHKNIFVIFDELFRGTNVKDAYDASLIIISALTKVKNSFFAISTHIVEVAHELKEQPDISFRYMETLFNNNQPYYSYKLKTGITVERLGLWIIKNENIIEIINSMTDKQG